MSILNPEFSPRSRRRLLIAGAAFLICVTRQVVTPAEPPKPAIETLPATAPTGSWTSPAGILPAKEEEVLAMQLALDRRNISPGSMDAVSGGKTTAAVKALQLKEQLTPTGMVDARTAALLRLNIPLYAQYIVTTADVSRLQPVPVTWVGKSQQTSLNYETLEELVAEKSHASPTLIRRLNPQVDWRQPAVGMSLVVPNVETRPEEKTQKAAFVRIYLEDRVLQAFDDKTNLLAHFPCSIAQQMSQRPLGALQVAVAIPEPNYTFDPAMFSESEEARALERKLIIPPGPNNPVGTVWIGLDRPGYGIHGTPRPEQVGRAESHGCFRLANWNAERLLRLVWLSMPIYILDGKQPTQGPERSGVTEPSQLPR